MMRGSVILLFVPMSIFSQTLSQEEAETFVQALLWNTSSLISWFDPSDLAVSHRLGIEYEGVENKNLIAYDVDDSTKRLVRNGHRSYSVTVESLDSQYARLILMIDRAYGAKEFYFRGRRCVSPLAYFARNWPIVESEHFRFFLSDSTLFNAYCREQLESFVERMAALLGLHDQEMETLSKRKIFYYLCRDEDEIQRLTGFRARGMVNLAYDAVVTTFNTHYHELLHLLINYELRHLSPYTHPFLQEGFAVAYGGRGGLESGVILPLGSFLYHSQFVELPTLLDSEGFRQLDASLSYPAAGLYNRFLIETIGIQPYLRLYRTHSGPFASDATLHISSHELPKESSWVSYLQSSAGRNSITLDSMSSHAQIIFKDNTLQIAEDGEKYSFLLSDVVVLPGNRSFPNYKSKTFQDVCPDKIYRGEKYLIRVTAEEISVYNLFTNNIIGSYASSFSIPSKRVLRIGDRYSFSISRRVFDDPDLPFPGIRNTESK